MGSGGSATSGTGGSHRAGWRGRWRPHRRGGLGLDRHRFERHGGLTGSDASVPIGGAPGGVYTCTPGVEELVITDCGYPATTSNPLTGTMLNENDVFRAIRPAGSWPNSVVQMFYNDEHAMTCGVRQVAVKSSAGTTTTDYPVTPLATNPEAPPIP